MELRYENQSLGFCENVCDIATEQGIDGDIPFPDYCPDIVRIMNCSVSPCVNGVSVTDGRAAADCSATVRVLYAAPEGKIAAYEWVTSFQAVGDAREIERNSAVTVSVKPDYVNCRAVSPRRIEVHASLHCRFRSDRKREESLLCGVSEGGVQCLTQQVQTVNIIGKTVRYFPMSEVAELEEGTGGVAHIISLWGNAIKGEIKVINNKLLLKGNLETKAYYLAEDGGVALFRHTMPISQILEMEGLTENSVQSLSLRVAGMEVTPKTDASGAVRLMDITACVEAVLCACEPYDLQVIEDIYSTQYPLKTQQKSVEVCGLADCVHDVLQNRTQVDLPGSGIEAVTAIWSSAPTMNLRQQEDCCLLFGSYEVNLLCKNGEGEPVFLQRTVDYEYKRNGAFASGKLQCNGDVTLLSLACTVPGSGKLEIKAELSIDALIFATGNVRYVAQVETEETEKKPAKDAALTVYFSEEGESLWNIAKKYSTTVDAIAQQNGMDGATRTKGEMLLIPAAN